MMPVRRPAHRVLASLAVVPALLLALAVPAHAEDGGAPAPPPDSTAVPAPPPAEPEPQSLAPAPALPATPVAGTAAAIAPGIRGASAFTWGDSTGFVLPPLAEARSLASIEADVAASRTLRGNAESRMLKARELSVRWKSQVEIQKSRESALKAQIDAAKKEKRASDQKDYEAQKKREEMKRGYYDLMRQALEAEADCMKAAFDYAQARMDEADVEKRLTETWTTGGYEGRISATSRDLEQRVLTMAKARADRMATLADRDKALADRRMAALKAWNELQR